MHFAQPLAWFFFVPKGTGWNGVRFKANGEMVTSLTKEAC